MKQVSTILLACALLIVMVGGSGAQDMETGTVSSAFSATGFAEAAGLGGVTGDATFDSANASIFINLIPNGAELPEGTVLEGWVVDVGRFAGSGYNASVADQSYGPPFGNLAFDVLVSAAPTHSAPACCSWTRRATGAPTFTSPTTTSVLTTSSLSRRNRMATAATGIRGLVRHSSPPA